MRKPASQPKIKTGSTWTSQRFPNGAVITTFEPPPADFDPLTADQSTLRNHGYPYRPSEPAALARWKELLGKPSRFIKPTIKRIPARRHLGIAAGLETFQNWSGAVVFSSAPDTLFTVSGRWKIPTFKPFANGDDLNVVIWIGLDGDHSNDVLQAGVHAAMSAGDEAPDLYAWFEWFPDDENSIGLPVASGDTMGCVITADQDCLPGFTVQQGKWSSIDGNHRLIPMHDGKVLDWKPDDGTWLLWNYDPTSKDCLPGGPVSQGRWESIRDGHCLVPMHDGKVLDWVPDDGTWRLWNYDPTNMTDCLPGTPVSHGQWESVRDGHVLVPMKDGKVIDWVPDNGTWRLWNYDPTNTKDCLPANAVSTGKWISLDDDHTLVPMHDGRVIDWVTDGSWRLWNYDPANQKDCLPANAVALGQWISIDDDHTLVAMHDGRVLDWQTDGTWRLWNYNPQGHSTVAGTIVLLNETQGLHATIHMQAPDNTHLRGNSAEWIVERPEINFELTKLLNYGSVKFTNAHAERTGGGLMDASDGDTIRMTENGKTISKATASGETVTCTFV